MFGVLDARADGAVALVYVVATVAMAFTAWSYAEMSRVVPHAGSVFAYASAGLGGAAGFLAGWLAMLDYLLIPSVAYLFSGIAMHALVPGGAGVGLHRGRLHGHHRAQPRAASPSPLASASWCCWSSSRRWRCSWWPRPSCSPPTDRRGPWLSPLVGLNAVSPAVILGGVSIAVLSFLGFDAIASFAEENTGETRQIGRAILLCLGVAGLAFVAQTAAAALVSTDLAGRPSAPTPNGRAPPSTT